MWPVKKITRPFQVVPHLIGLREAFGNQRTSSMRLSQSQAAAVIQRAWNRHEGRGWNAVSFAKLRGLYLSDAAVKAGAHLTEWYSDGNLVKRVCAKL